LVVASGTPAMLMRSFDENHCVSGGHQNIVCPMAPFSK